MNEYRYQLERYRGPSTRYRCPQCGRKGTFSRYIDTYNNNIYISDNVGICNRIDKCGYHYTPKQYFTDNPWKRDDATTNNGSLRPPKQYYTDNPWKRDDATTNNGSLRPPKQYYTDNPWKSESGWTDGRKHRETVRPSTPPPINNGSAPHRGMVECRTASPRACPFSGRRRSIALRRSGVW